jgi:hypothetical protein
MTPWFTPPAATFLTGKWVLVGEEHAAGEVQACSYLISIQAHVCILESHIVHLIQAKYVCHTLSTPLQTCPLYPATCALTAATQQLEPSSSQASTQHPPTTTPTSSSSPRSGSRGP